MVIGCGNRSAGDDAVGLMVIDRLDALELQGVSLREMDDFVPGFLREAGRHAAIVVVVDAVRSEAVPGAIHLLRWPSITAGSMPKIQGISTHLLDLDEELELAMICGVHSDLFLLGIEVGEIRAETQLSEPVRSALDHLVEHFTEYCEQMRASSASVSSEVK